MGEPKEAGPECFKHEMKKVFEEDDEDDEDDDDDDDDGKDEDPSEVDIRNEVGIRNSFRDESCNPQKMKREIGKEKDGDSKRRDQRREWHPT